MNAVATLPPAVERLLAAVAAQDQGAFVAQFAMRGIVDDWGLQHVGREAIARWSEREFIGSGGRLVPRQFQPSDNGAVLTADWFSGFYNGRIRISFAVEGDLIARMNIANA